MGSADNHQSASWQVDPFGRHEQRWWDGSAWTEKVRSDGTTGIDAPGVDANPEHAHPNVPAPPILDANEPVRYASPSLPTALLIGVVVLVAILAIIIYSLAG